MDSSPTQEGILSADVVIVGAGISGLSAAHHIREKDASLRVLILEGKDRVGGRTFTTTLSTAHGQDYWDLGGQWVGRTQPHILALLEKLGLKTYKQDIAGKKCMKLGDDKVRTYNSTIPSLPFSGLVDLGLMIDKIEKLSKTVPIENPMECKNAHEWDSISMDAFMLKHSWTRGAIDAGRCALRVMFGVEPSQASFLYFLSYLNACGGFSPAIEATENSGQELKIEDGAQQVSIMLSKQLGEENVLLRHAVTKIIQTDNEVTVITDNGKTIQCRRVILAIPPVQAGLITYEPRLPGEKYELYKRMPVGHTIKFIVTYEMAFWKDNGFSGEIVSNGGKCNTDGCDKEPICITFDATTVKGSPALVGFICGDQGVQWSRKDPEERKQAVLNDLAIFLGSDALKCIDYADKDWSLEPYNGGCPVYPVTTGAMAYFTELRRPFNRLHFAGTETSTVWCGYMNGAVQSGQRAATEVLYHLRPQTVTMDDLQDTYYGKPVKKANLRKKGSKKGIILLTISIGVLLAFCSRKAYVRFSK